MQRALIRDFPLCLLLRHVYRSCAHIQSSLLVIDADCTTPAQIEHLAVIQSIERDEGGCTLVIANAGRILDDCSIGDSIAVNGACLTVTEFDAGKGTFKVWLANETLSRTAFGQRRRSGACVLR
jgi:hypothetical protein